MIARAHYGSVVLALALAFGAGPAQAQQPITPKIWDIPLGTHVRDLPANDFVEPACGSNGGPPGRVIGSFEEFALCPAEAATGIHEVWFIYDDTFEYVLLARRDPQALVGQHKATVVFNQPVILSFLVAASGHVVGYRIFADPRTQPELRYEAYALALVFRGRAGNEGWECTDLPPAEGERPMDGRFVKQYCEKNADGRRAIVEARFFYKPGQTRVNPFNQRQTVNEFESWARLEVSQTEPLSQAVLDRLAAAAVAPEAALPADASPRDRFLAGVSADCPGCDLAGADLRRRDLADADLSGANLDGAVLHRANLRNANLSSASLVRANLNRADLTFATVRDADLTRATLFLTDAARADFSGANFYYASMGRVRLTLSVLEGANLDFTDLGEARMNEAKLAGATLTRAFLRSAVLFRADMRGVTAEWSVFVEAGMRDADLSGAVVRNSNLQSADLAGANLSNADFSSSQLLSASLHETNQAGTIFSGAIMPDNSIAP